MNALSDLNVSCSHALPYRAMAPGRVNLIGEHTDYKDGFTLPLAIDRWAAMRLLGGAKRPNTSMLGCHAVCWIN